MLTAEQKRSFMRDGYLVLEDAFDDGHISEARDLIWDAVPDDPTDPDSLVGVGSRSPSVPADEPFASINERIHEYATALVGDALSAPDGPGMQLALRYPRECRLDDYHEREPSAGHLDGYGPGFYRSGEYRSFTVAGVVYFDRVPARGGGFTVWPGSHLVAANYFEDHGLNTPGAEGHLPAIDDDADPGESDDPRHGWDQSRTLYEQLRSRQLTGGPGTLILWHNKLMHTAGINQSDVVRMAGIKRMSRDDYDETYEDAADKPFEYWDGLDGIDLD